MAAHVRNGKDKKNVRKQLLSLPMIPFLDIAESTTYLE
jgi:hypothetical protein